MRLTEEENDGGGCACAGVVVTTGVGLEDGTGSFWERKTEKGETTKLVSIHTHVLVYEEARH